jgi:hypothetical protein
MSKRAQNGKDTKNCIKLQNWQKMVHNAMHKMANEHTLAQVAKMALNCKKYQNTKIHFIKWESSDQIAKIG